MEVDMRMQSRAGFALPVALFAIGILTVTVAAAFTRVDNELRITRDRDAGLDAYAAAQGGMEHYLMNRKALGFTDFPPPPAETARFVLNGDSVRVITTQLRPITATAEAMYHVRSTGTARRGASNQTPPAERTVSQYAVFRLESLSVNAAWTSLSGLEKNGKSGTISGFDNCGVKPPVAGVAVPDGLWDTNTFTPTGSPGVLEMGTKAQMANAVKIDWDAIINGNAIQPDYTIPGDSWPSFADPDFFPVIRYNGNLSLASPGRGTLIVTGNFTVSGSKYWEGIILVGGSVTSNGNNTVEGTVISGLNEKLGDNVAESDAGNGTKTYVYDSCKIDKALARISALRVVPGTWSDNWTW
jgi:hypothetical protein